MNTREQSSCWTVLNLFLRKDLARIGLICFIVFMILPLMWSGGSWNCYGQEFINPVREIFSYRFKFSKLRDGTFGNVKVDTLILDKSVLNFQWKMSGKLLEYDKQVDPVAFAKSFQIDSVLFDVDNSLVTYWNDSTAQYLKRFDELTPGEWQVQLSASRWDSTNNKAVWSKFSDAVAFYVLRRTLPFDVPGFFKIKFE